jgi:N-acetylglucosamine kinase-like BadF-type ATPase
MKLIAESGATKSTWILVDNGLELKRFVSLGIRPLAVSEQEIHTILSGVFAYFEKDTFSDLHYFGSGCHNRERAKLMSNFLNAHFAKKCNVNVEGDLVAAALSTLGSKAGVVGILGTGSVGFYWNGNEVEKICGGKGFPFGDEGSGADMGKRLLKFCMNTASSVCAALEVEVGDLSNFHTAAFHAVNPASEFGKLSYFIANHKENEDIQKIIKLSFDDFILDISPLQIYSNQINLVGSIAHYFREEIENQLYKSNWRLDKCHLQAIDFLR